MTRSVLGKLFVASPFIAVLACLSSNPGQDESTDPASSSSGTSPESSGESTLGGLMTTTEEPESEDSGAAASTGDETSEDASSGTTQVIPPECGDGNHDANEECDNGNANANDAACTLACTVAVCGDGFVEAGKETCDDGVNDGAYGGCMPDCMALGPYCGDLTVQGEESCDDDDPDAGCLKDKCEYAVSCLEIKEAWGVFALSGIYPIHPKAGVDVDAYCDMETDDGGYTFVKFGGTDPLTAAAAETKCSEVGLHLLVPRTAAHLASSYAVASDQDVIPIEGEAPMKASNYLRIFGIYPKTAGESCVGQPLNKTACPEWEASDGDAYWISDSVLALDQPSTNNCADCSMAYFWTGDMLTSYSAFIGDGMGADSNFFVCDAGDKHGMN